MKFCGRIMLLGYIYYVLEMKKKMELSIGVNTFSKVYSDVPSLALRSVFIIKTSKIFEKCLFKTYFYLTDKTEMFNINRAQTFKRAEHKERLSD